jgi:hypothetical protein
MAGVSARKRVSRAESGVGEREASLAQNDKYIVEMAGRCGEISR